jgi:hypothetical protein
MSIHYILRRNTLATNPYPYRAAVKSVETIEFEELIEHIIARETTVGESDIRSVITDFIKVVETFVLQGMNVNTPLANFRASIKGGFDSPDDGFDPERHQVVARVSAGKRLRQTIANRARVVKEEIPEKRKPLPFLYLDVVSGEENSTLTPGGMGRLHGHRLKFDPADATQGIFFVHSDHSETPVEVVGENLPAKLIFTVPALPAGDYRLTVRAVVGSSGEVRSGTLDETLTVL